jgi:hypothetical protein
VIPKAQAAVTVNEKEIRRVNISPLMKILARLNGNNFNNKRLLTAIIKSYIGVL